MGVKPAVREGGVGRGWITPIFRHQLWAAIDHVDRGKPSNGMQFRLEARHSA
jgi:hypothetical protein